MLFDEAENVLCRSACQWAGVPLNESEVKQRTREFSKMIDGFGGIGRRYRLAKNARSSSEKWVIEIIKRIRSGKLNPSANTAAYIIAWHRDLHGKLLNVHTAAVELINILRPIVAIGRYITFGALALHHYPEVKQRLLADKERYSLAFVQEVRRFYPFGPFTGARVRKSFSWNGYRFDRGTLVLLDIYGTNRHPGQWEHPDEFKPERFQHWEGSPFSFIPQGGGDHYSGHRCAGEWITVKLMRVSLEFLTAQLTYRVPEQDLSYRLNRIPPIPNSRFIINRIQANTTVRSL